ncbi:CHMP5 [Symbiodinium microadriaticum]|nr:CHMP5 [Symbiodinium microadriaticum]
MHRLFGKKKEVAPPPDLGETSKGLNGRVAALDEKIKAADNELRVYKTQIAKAKGPAKAGIQRRAVEVLKRKKMYEQQRDQLCGQAFNLDQAAFAMETIKDTHTTVAAMKDAAKQLKVEHAKIDLNEIEDLNDDLADMFEDMNEISETLGRSYGTPDYIDEDDLEAELACLGDEFDEELTEEVSLEQPSYLSPSGMPHVPAAGLPVPTIAQPQAPQPSGVDEFGLPVQNIA